MKQKCLAVLVGLAMVLGLVGCGTAVTAAGPASQTGGNSSSAVAQSSSAAPAVASSSPASSATITEAEAKAIALEHAGFAESEVTFVGVHLDYDDGRQVYEVEFYSGATEYDYDIDAASGEIVGYDTDIENYAIGSGQGNGQQAGVSIDESAAKAIALEKVPGATEADIRIRLDYDDGRPVYEGTIVYSEMKYEFEISAADGTVLEWDAESVYDD